MGSSTATRVSVIEEALRVMITFRVFWEEDYNFLFVQTNHLVRCRSGLWRDKDRSAMFAWDKGSGPSHRRHDGTR